MLIAVARFVNAQTSAAPPQNSVVEVKRVVQVNGKWYVETITTTRVFEPLTTEMLMKVDKDSSEDAELDNQIKAADDAKKQKKAEQAERNRLLRQALRNGYVPEVNTLEDQKRIDAIKKRLGI